MPTQTGQIGQKRFIRIPLDVNGYIQGTNGGPLVFLYPNDKTNPPTLYKVRAYSAHGQESWGPHYMFVPTQNVPHNIDLGWIPNPKD